MESDFRQSDFDDNVAAFLPWRWRSCFQLMKLIWTFSSFLWTNLTFDPHRSVWAVTSDLWSMISNQLVSPDHPLWSPTLTRLKAPNLVLVHALPARVPFTSADAGSFTQLLQLPTTAVKLKPDRKRELSQEFQNKASFTLKWKLNFRCEIHSNVCLRKILVPQKVKNVSDSYDFYFEKSPSLINKLTRLINSNYKI